MSNELSSLTALQLHRAAELKEKIEVLNEELDSILVKAAPVSSQTSKKRGMSAAGRARIAAAQKARWAKAKSSKSARPALKAPAKRKGMSASARAKIAAAARARWAKAKASGKKTL